MSHEPVVNWDVPKPPVLSQIPTIPPLFVELPVCEVSDLCEEVEAVLERGKEHDDPADTCWEGEFEDL